MHVHSKDVSFFSPNARPSSLLVRTNRSDCLFNAWTLTAGRPEPSGIDGLSWEWNRGYHRHTLGVHQQQPSTLYDVLTWIQVLPRLIQTKTYNLIYHFQMYLHSILQLPGHWGIFPPSCTKDCGPWPPIWIWLATQSKGCFQRRYAKSEVQPISNSYIGFLMVLAFFFSQGWYPVLEQHFFKNWLRRISWSVFFRREATPKSCSKDDAVIGLA